MASAVKAATLLQIGKETVRGTLVAATRRMTGGATVRRTMAQEMFEDEMYGVLARTARAPVITANGFELEYTAPLSFEELLLPLLSGMKGAVTPTGAGADKTWTFTPGVAADPVPDTFTVEWVESDFTNDQEWEAGYAFTTGWGVKVGVTGLAELSVSMAARKAVSSTKTASVALPALNYAPALTWKVYVDDAWAGLGTTPVTGQVYGADWKFDTGIKPQTYLDGRAAVDFSQYEFGSRSAELSLEAVVSPTAGIVIAEQAKKDTPALRFVRLELSGAALGGGTYKIQIDGAYYHAEDSLSERGADRDGNMITGMHLLSAYDPTGAQDVRVLVVNALTAYP